MHVRFPSLNRPILAAPAARGRARLYQDHDVLWQRRPGSEHFSTLTTRITTFLGAVDEVRPFSPAALARARATAQNRTSAAAGSAAGRRPEQNCAARSGALGRLLYEGQGGMSDVGDEDVAILVAQFSRCRSYVGGPGLC